MYGLLSLLAGVLIAVMLVCNGGLTAHYGVYPATVVIHVTGLAVMVVATLVRRDCTVFQKQRWPLYLGGVIGVATTAFNNVSFGRISVSAILALGLLGQSITGLLIDQFGWMGMPRRPMVGKKLIGVALIALGIAVMLTRGEPVAVIVSLLAGVTVVVSRSVNAALAARTSVTASTFFNYLTGLLAAVPLLLLLDGAGALPALVRPLAPQGYVYLGSVLGVLVVLLSNITVRRISAFYMTLFMFVGQVFSGVAIDWLMLGTLSVRQVLGSALVACGLLANLWMDRLKAPADETPAP